MPLNFCVRCGAKFKGAGRFCPEHSAKAETSRIRDRLILEPWRVLFDRPEWPRARAAALRRDGNRCRALVRGHRCTETAGVQVHHKRPLSELWKMSAGLEDLFIEKATALDNLVTLCRHHHDEADSARRAGERLVFS